MGSITLSLILSLFLKPRQQQQHMYGGPELASDPFSRGNVAPHPGYHNPQPVYSPPQQYAGRPPPPGRAPLTTPPPEYPAAWDGKQWIPLQFAGQAAPLPPNPQAPVTTQRGH
eukprot:Rhum_TRINITY_DN11083_c0_g1::Rhum_TRINITY_DN11083_c0_g1_i1::g.42257::m.42257